MRTRSFDAETQKTKGAEGFSSLGAVLPLLIPACAEISCGGGKPKTKNQKPKIKNQKPKTKNQKPKTIPRVERTALPMYPL
jgi:hypothetical protein